MGEPGFLIGTTVAGLLALLVTLWVLGRRSRPTTLGVGEGIRLVESYFAEGRIMEAMVVCKRLARAAPQNLRIRLLLVDVLHAQRHDQEALAELQRLSAERPGSVEVAARLENLKPPQR